MEDWKKELKDMLMRFDFPVEVADLRRLVGLSSEDMPLLFDEIAQIAKSLAGTPYALVVEEGKCSSCFLPVRFTGKIVYTCPRCGGFANPPKVCINPK
ncbi:MAG: hypothetical protein ACXADC_08015 [Candidatus Thorarchaeota archaeon]